MTTSEKMREILAEKNIHNGLDLAEYLDSDGVIFFFAGSENRMQDCKAELVYTDSSGDLRSIERHPWRVSEKTGSISERRTAALKMIYPFAEAFLGIKSWSKTPFSNCWLPSEDVSKMHKEFNPEEG